MSDYEHKRKTVKAIRLENEVYDSGGVRLAVKGDWIVIEGNRQYFMTDKDFTDQFQTPKSGKDWLDEFNKIIGQQPKTHPVPEPYPVPRPYPVYPPPWPGYPYGTWCDGTVSISQSQTTFVSRVE